MKNVFIKIILLLVCIAGFSAKASAQFRNEAFSQSYNEKSDTLSRRDTAAQLFSFKELFGGLAHKNEMKIGTMFVGSVFMPGSAQIYNKDYWKLPVIYGGIGACAGVGGYLLGQDNPTQKNTGKWFLAGAGLIYWGSLMDGVVCYQKDTHPHPGRSTLYSVLLPGLGQAYNGELWKLPIYWGCLAGATYFCTNFNKNYQRFKRIHNEATSPDIEYQGGIDGETALWYRDVYRRYRDYSIVALAGFYLLQIIDANIFAYMHDFEVTDNLSMQVEPTLIAPDNYYALGSPNAVGMRVGFRF